MDEQKQDDQLQPTYSSSVPIRDIAWKTCRGRWTMERGSEWGSGRSVLVVRHDDHEYYLNHGRRKLVDSYISPWYYFESEPNNSTGVRTRLLQYPSQIR